MMTAAIAVPARPVVSTLATPGAEVLRERLRALSAPPGSISVAWLVDSYMAQYKGRDKTRGSRMAVWRTMLGDFTLDQVTSDLIFVACNELADQPALSYKGRDFAGRPTFEARDRKKPRTAATVNRYLASLAALFSWAKEGRLTPRNWVNPCKGAWRGAESEGRLRYLSEAERERLLAACKESRYPRLHALVLTAILTGARRGELLALRWEDVDLAAGTALLGRTKNGDSRTLVLLPQVVEILRPFEGDAKRYVFGSVRGKYQRPASNIEAVWREARAKADLGDVVFHSLRHTCASYMAQAGVPLYIISDVLGHRSMKMTMRYAHLSTASKAKAMQAALGEIK